MRESITNMRVIDMVVYDVVEHIRCRLSHR
jgi:hypothetical protein